MGGRGSSFSDGTGLFEGGNSGGPDKTRQTLPAYLNRKGVGGNEDNMIEYFRQRYGSSDHEWGAAIDENGYAVGHVEGNEGNLNPSITPHQHAKSIHYVHNHPAKGWGNFSGADLETFANAGYRGLSAVSKKTASKNRMSGTYKIERTASFKASDFVTAIHNVSVSQGDYDRTLSNWLKRNQKKYGYKFTYTPGE